MVRNDPDFAAVFVLKITEGRHHHDAVLLLLLISRVDLTGEIADVHIVEQSLEADHQIVRILGGIEVFRHGKHPDLALPQEIQIYRRMRPMPSESGHILDDHRVDPFFFHRRGDFFNPGTVEVHPADVVVEGLADDLITVLFGVLPDQLPLVFQRIHFLIVVARKPRV